MSRVNKSALKKFATEARKELLERVELQARKIGITADSIQKATVESSDAVFIDGRQLSDIESRQRNKLIKRIEEIGFDRVMEETAYTWFNRFIALRYMEVNDYLPTKVRVLSSYNADSAEPDMMKEALSLDLELDKEYVYELKMANKTDELFKYLIKVHCNDLNRYMPFMFETIEDYKEILFPEGLLGTDSFVRQMTNPEVIAENDWESVEIIGWLYQYYISEENERVIKAKKRYKAEELPFATQLFTPEWIVRYMVQNTLGRYWIESHPVHRDLISNWEYYLENPNPESDFEEKLAPYINKELNVEDIKCFDPAMGSGHILVYMIDVLYEIYSKCGYVEREIPRLIIEKNLYGLDIDDRAYQLASFSIVMKALQYNKRFLRSIERDGLLMNLQSIQETNKLTDEEIAFLAGESLGENYNKMKCFIGQFQNAKAIGSLLIIENFDVDFLQNRIAAIEHQNSNLFELAMKDRLLKFMKQLLKQAEILLSKYDVFVTNPPYAGRNYMTNEILEYVNKYYSKVKSDLFSSFIVRSFISTKDHGQIGLMTPFVWMFISTYEQLRNLIIDNKTISSLIQLEYSGFDGATVPICTFTLKNYKCGELGEYIRLSDFKGSKYQPVKALEAVRNKDVYYRYSFNQDNLKVIPSQPIAYWISSKAINYFENGKVGNYLDTREGMTTADNDKFVREWYEVEISKSNLKERFDMKEKKWFAYQKGGNYRKWYGNLSNVVNWHNEGHEIKNHKDELTGRIRSHNYNGDYVKREGLTFSSISSGDFSCRYSPENFYFDTASGMGYADSEENLYYIIALLNSNVANYYFKVLAPTLNIKLNNLMSMPLIIKNKEVVVDLCKQCIEIAKADWNGHEISWDFSKNPLINSDCSKIGEFFENVKNESKEISNTLLQLEEKLNSIFIEIYDLKNEISSEVELKNIALLSNPYNRFKKKKTKGTENDLLEEFTQEEYDEKYLETTMKEFISYFIGCTFGRYSLDEEGLIFAGGEFDASRYKTFPADKDNILPILHGAYFEDDIVTKFVDFVRITFSEETLEENLDFIADAIGRKKTETAREAIRRYFLNDFYKDHVQTYKKRPIYWQFTSGKEKAFNCLIYMHRHDETTLSRIRTDYLHEVQIRMDAEKKDLLSIIEGDYTTKEINDAKKEMKSLDKKIDELKAYDELLHHMADKKFTIDLDKGVKDNYDLFKGLVAKI